MLGHMVSCYFKKKKQSNLILCSRSKTNIITLDENLIKISEYSKKQLFDLIDQHRPCKIINCVGVTNINENEKKLNLINTELPILLAKILDRKKDGSQLIQISTDGVFSGKRGNYIESDQPDASDAYSQSKLKGEVVYPPHLTIRTSIIGPQLKSNDGLLEWFLKQKKEISGYSNVTWNGVTTLECAKFIDWTINHKLTGLIHLFSEKISKYDLLNVMKKVYRKNIKINSDKDIKLDRSLNTERSDMNYVIPDHHKMLEELKSFSLFKKLN